MKLRLTFLFSILRQGIPKSLSCPGWVPTCNPPASGSHWAWAIVPSSGSVLLHTHEQHLSHHKESTRSKATLSPQHEETRDSALSLGSPPRGSQCARTRTPISPCVSVSPSPQRALPPPCWGQKTGAPASKVRAAILPSFPHLPAAPRAFCPGLRAGTSHRRQLGSPHFSPRLRESG